MIWFALIVLAAMNATLLVVQVWDRAAQRRNTELLLHAALSRNGVEFAAHLAEQRRVEMQGERRLQPVKQADIPPMIGTHNA